MRFATEICLTVLRWTLPPGMGRPNYRWDYPREVGFSMVMGRPADKLTGDAFLAACFGPLVATRKSGRERGLPLRLPNTHDHRTLWGNIGVYFAVRSRVPTVRYVQASGSHGAASERRGVRLLHEYREFEAVRPQSIPPKSSRMNRDFPKARVAKTRRRRVTLSEIWDIQFIFRSMSLNQR